MTAQCSRIFPRATTERFLCLGLFSLLAVFVLVPLILLFRTGINWDEFYFLSKVHDWQRGEQPSILQSGYIPFFAWVTNVSGHAVDQIIAARTAVWFLYALSFFFLYRIAIRFQSALAALFSLVLLASFSFVLDHGASFRYDPIAIFLLVSCGILALQKSSISIAVAGAVFALAVLVTIKSILVLPAILGLFILREAQLNSTSNLRRQLQHAAMFLTAAASTVAIYLTLRWTAIEVSAAPTQKSLLSESFRRMFLDVDFIPRAEYLSIAIRDNPAFFLFFACSFIFLIARSVSQTGKERLKSVALLGISAPVATLLFYRNAYPYFYWFILPYPALISGTLLDYLRNTQRLCVSLHNSAETIAIFASLITALLLQALDTRLFWLPLLLIPALLAWKIVLTLRTYQRYFVLNFLVIMSCIFVSWPLASRIYAGGNSTLETQRRVLDVVYDLFPDEVPYIDRCSMVSNYRKVGFFMSTWGLDRYHEAGKPIFSDIIRDQQPQFLLMNHPALNPQSAWPYPVGLFPQDITSLRSNFVHHWGPIWVPGYRFEANGPTMESVINISGEYLLESDRPVTINGRLVWPGQTVLLQKGLNSFTLGGSPLNFVLHYAVKKPELPEPDGPLLRGFGIQ